MGFSAQPAGGAPGMPPQKQDSLVHDERDHPGLTPSTANVGLPKTRLIVWPQEAVEAMLALADETGRLSLVDGVMTMVWLGARRQTGWHASDDLRHAFSCM